MREIKFRGKRRDSGEWVRGKNILLLAQDDGSEIPFIVPSGEEILCGLMIFKKRPLIMGSNIISVHPDTVGQFTGLRDRNGIEIYDGDIVTILEPDLPAEVKWNEREATYEVLYPEGYPKPSELYLWAKYCEVIGNIHDNPELLKIGGDD